MPCPGLWNGCSTMASSSTPSEWAAAIVAEARRLGFAACGFAAAAAVPEAVAGRYDEWLLAGRHGCMSYMERYADVRRNPALLCEGARTVVCVTMNYMPSRLLPPSQPQFARYAYGRDYHEVMRDRLQRLAQYIGQLAPCRNRVCCDTAPILERYWAVQSGLGFVGRHSQLVTPGCGSYCFLGEIVTTLALPPSQPVAGGGCGDCRRCVDACPAHAIGSDGTVDARRCLSCLTIENRGAIPSEAARCMGRRVYGCDTCQEVCPYNRGVQPSDVPELQPSDDFMQLTYDRLRHLTRDEYRRIFAHSAVKRAKYEGLMRNIEALSPALFGGDYGTGGG